MLIVSEQRSKKGVGTGVLTKCTEIVQYKNLLKLHIVIDFLIEMTLKESRMKSRKY